MPGKSNSKSTYLRDLSKEAAAKIGSAGTNITKVGGTTVPTAGSTPSVPTVIYDGDGNQITSFGGITLPPNSIMIGSEVGSYTFDASLQTVTIAGIADLDLEEVLKIVNVTDQIVIYDPESGAKGGSIASNAITLEYDTTTMADTDNLQVFVKYNNSEDYTLGVKKTREQSPIYSHYTSAENLVTDSDIGAVDDTYVDQGSEIDCQGYKTLAIYVNFTVNDSTGNQLQVLSKHESAGSDEYILETAADYQKTIGDASVKIVYFFNVEGIPFVQIQTKATDVDDGGGTEGTLTIDIIKEY